MMRIVLSLLVLSSAVVRGQDFDYCTLNSKCKNGASHTMCLYKTETPSPLCGNLEPHFLTSQEKKDVLDKHNELRALIARGEVPNHPRGRNVKDLAWSEEDELIARRWALQCDYGHDKCRNLRDGTYAGQNLAIFGSTRGFRGMHIEAVQDWFDEYKVYVPNRANTFSHNVQGAGHYTQMVWEKTTHVGCEQIYFHYNKGTFADMPGVEYLVCVYSPGGNYVDEKVYEVSGDDSGGNGDPVPEGDGDSGGNGDPVPEGDGGSGGNGDPVPEGDGGSGENGDPVDSGGEATAGTEKKRNWRRHGSSVMKRESCVFTLLVSLVIALRSNLFDN